MIGTSDYVLLIDETGMDDESLKIIVVGCFLNTSCIKNIEDKVKSFYLTMRDSPQQENRVEDCYRHFNKDHFTIRENFIERVLLEIPLRIYSFRQNNPKVEAEKKVDRVCIYSNLTKQLVRSVKSQQRLKGQKLCIIVEDSVKQARTQLRGFDSSIQFKSKEFVALSIADYYCGMFRSYQEKLNKIKTNPSLLKNSENSLDINFYKTHQNKIAHEYDVSTKQTFSRYTKFNIFWQEYVRLKKVAR